MTKRDYLKCQVRGYGKDSGIANKSNVNSSDLQKDCWHIPLKVTNVKFNFNVRFLTLIHEGKTKRQKPNIKMDSFVREEAYTIQT